MFRKSESGNAVLVVLGVLVVVAVGALAYLSGQMTAGGEAQNQEVQERIQQVQEQNQQILSQVRPGNPVVAKVNGKDILREEVLVVYNNLPMATRQTNSIEVLFPEVLAQVINNKVISEKASKARLGNNKQVKQQLEELKKQVVRNVFVEKEIDKLMTDERKQEAYKLLSEQHTPVEQAEAYHILVETRKEAREVIKKLGKGADIKALAIEYSIDATKNNQGNEGYLGFFSKTDVLPEFAESTFSLEPGEHSKVPIETEVGFHVVKLVSKRMSPAPTFEQMEQFIEGQLRQALLNDLLRRWREDSSIEVFNINGDPLQAAQPPANPESAG